MPRLSRVLTDRSSYRRQSTDSNWIDYLEDTRVTLPPGVISNKSRLSEGVPRNSKWWVDLEDSVHVPPPLTAESNSGSESPFSSGNETFGRRPVPRREIMRNTTRKRKQATKGGFDDVFYQDEPTFKKERGSSLKRSSPESVYEEASPISQPTKGERKGLFRKAPDGVGSTKGRKSQSSKYAKVFDDSDDEILPSSSRRVPKGSSESIHSASPELRPARPSKRVLSTKTSRTRTGRADLEISLSDNEGETSKKHLSSSDISASPVSKSRKSLKKVTLLKQRKVTTTSAFDTAFSDEEDGDSPNRSPKESQPSVLDRSQSPALKSKRTSKKVLSARKSRTSKPDLAVSFNDSDDGKSNDVDVEKVSDRSPSPISKSGKGLKKVTLLKRQKVATSSAFDKAFSEEEDYDIPGRSPKKSQPSVLDRSQSPALKSKRTSKKVLSARKPRTSKPDLAVSFSDSGDGKSYDDDVEKLSDGFQSNFQKNSQSPALNSKGTSTKILTARKSHISEPDLAVSFSDSEEGKSNDVDAENLSDRSPSPILKSGKGPKKVTLLKQRRKVATTSAFDKAFSEEEDYDIPGRSPKKSQPSVLDRSQSPALKSKRTSKKVLSARKHRTSKPDLAVSFSDSGDGKSNDVDVEKVSDRSPSPILKSGKGPKKVTLLKQRRVATSSAFDKAFSEEEDYDIPGRSPKKSQPSVLDRSQSPALKSKRTSKKVLSARKPRTSKPDLAVSFNDSDDGKSNDVDVEKLSDGFQSNFHKNSQSPALNSKRTSTKILTARKSRTSKPDLAVSFSDSDEGKSNEVDAENLSDRSPSPILKSGKGPKKVTLLKQRKVATTSAFDKAFSDDEDGDSPNRSPKESQPSVMDRSQSPALKSKRMSKKVLGARKHRTSKPDLAVSFSDSGDGKSNDVDVEKVLERSPSPISKSEKGLKKLTLLKQRKVATSSAFDKAFSDEENYDIPGHSPKKSQPSVLDRSQSPATFSGKLTKKNLLSRKSQTIPAFDEAFGIDVVISRSRDESAHLSFVNQSPSASNTKSNKPLKQVSLGKKSGIAMASDIENTSDNDKSSGGPNTRRVSKRLSAGVTKSRKELPSTDQSHTESADTSNKGGGVENPQRSRRNDSFAAKPASRVTEDILQPKKQKKRSEINKQKEVNVDVSNPSPESHGHLSRTSRSGKPKSSSNIVVESDEDEEEQNAASNTGRSSRHLKNSVLSSSMKRRQESENLPSPDKAHDYGGSDSNLPAFVQHSLANRSLQSGTNKESSKGLPQETPGRNHDNDKVTPKNPRSSLKKYSTNRSRIVYANDSDNLVTLTVGSRSRKESDSEAGRVSLIESVERASKDTTLNPLQNINDPQKVTMITPGSVRSTLFFAHEANFTNFNPKANSTKVLHVSNSLGSVSFDASRKASPSKKLSTTKLGGTDSNSKTAQGMVSAAAGAPSSPNAKGAANASSRKELSKDLSDADVSIIGSWSGAGAAKNATVSDTSMGSSDIGSPEDVAPRKSLPLPAAKPPAQVPIPPAPVKKYTAEQAAVRRKEYFATLLERAKKDFPHLVADAPVKQKTMTDFYPKATALPKVRKEPKPIHPSLMVNGKKYKPPKLLRPAQWCTDRLYTFVQKRTTHLYGELKMRRKSEEFIVALAANVKKAIRNKKNPEPHVIKVVYLLEKLGLIESILDFYVFVENYMPMEFSDVAVPKLKAYGVTTGLKCFIKANVKEHIDFSKLPDFEK